MFPYSPLTKGSINYDPRPGDPSDEDLGDPTDVGLGDPDDTNWDDGLGDPPRYN